MKGDLIAIRFKGATTDGNVFDDTTKTDEPLYYRVGTGSLIAGIDRFLLGLDGCGIPVSSTSGTQHCPLRHAHAPVWKQIPDAPRHRRDVVPVTASARWRGASNAIDATLQ